jgi:hypothetical protein
MSFVFRAVEALILLLWGILTRDITLRNIYLKCKLFLQRILYVCVVFINKNI